MTVVCKIIFLWAALLYLGATSVIAQEDTLQIPFIAYWAQGESLDFKITKVKRQYLNGNLQSSDSSYYVANFQVIDSSESHYEIKWTFTDDYLLSSIHDNVDFDELPPIGITHLRYKTDEYGAFIELMDVEELIEKLSTFYSLLIQQLVSKSNDAIDFDELYQNLSFMYSTKQALEQYYFKELLYFHFPLGASFYASDTVFYEDILPNLFGGDPINSDAYVYFDYIDEESNFCVMVQESSLNTEDSWSMIYDYYSRLHFPQDEIEAFRNKSRLEIWDYNTYQYFYLPGIPYYIETRREVLIDIENAENYQVDITRIELLLEADHEDPVSEED